MSPTPSRSPTASDLLFITPRPDETIPEYITKKPKLAEYLARYPEEEDKQASREFNKDVATWNQNRNAWIEERQEEIAGDIVDWEKAKADAENKLEDWRKDRDGWMETRRKQWEAEEEEVQMKTTVLESEVKSEPLEYTFSDADKRSMDMDWESFYPTLTPHQQMIFQSGFIAKKKTLETSGAKRKGKAKETSGRVMDAEEVRTGPLLPIACKKCLVANVECCWNVMAGANFRGLTNTCFRCRKKKGKCVVLDRSRDGARSDVGSMKSKNSEGNRKSAGRKEVHLAPEVEKVVADQPRNTTFVECSWC
ncbi:hypothetical protein AAF712_008470 [Marasmius tenuissimus]|uniref:Zn(2)-C6 fungal-type domain-containing protein n=1 Tax=Marasmius tenuissimus TaxID=585030 RepID=A0ABR2ZT70_9AGAR